MKRMLCTVAALALFTAPAMAQFTDYQVSNMAGQVIWQNGQSIPSQRGVDPEPGSIYSNFGSDTFSGQVVGSLTAQNQSGNGITSMIMDDLQLAGVTPNGDVTQVGFTVFNGNLTTVSVRARIRFWFDDGTIPGAPGAYYTNPQPPNANIGFTFNPFSFEPNSITRLTGTIGAGVWQFGSNIKVWAGITFDNNTGGTGATLAQLVNFGQGIWDANADIGSSDPNNAFETDTAGSFFTIPNPSGNQLDFGYDGTPLGGPPANFGWEIVQVPEPATMALVGLGALGLLRRRR